MKSEAFWIKTIIVVNLLITGFVAGFTVAYYVLTQKTFGV